MENKDAKATNSAGPAQPIPGTSNCYIQPQPPVYEQCTCPCCGGTGTQTRLDGIKVICPGCSGVGTIAIPYIQQPYVWPQPYYPQPWQGPWVITSTSLPEKKK